MPSRVSLRQLEYFNRVVAAGSIRKAADSLGVSQPAITQAIKELETFLGASLLSRTGGGVILTAHGSLFHRSSTSALAQIASGIEELRSLVRHAEASIVIAGPTVSSSRIISRSVARFKRRFPLVPVMLHSADQSKALEDLHQGTIDLYYGRQIAEDVISRVHFEPLFQDRLIIIAGREEACTEEFAGLASLVDRPWVFPSADSSVSELTRDIFRDRGVAFPRNYVEMSVGDHMWEYLRATGAISVVPSNLVADEIQSRRLFYLGSEADWILPQVGFGLSKKSESAKHVSDFVQELRRVSIQRRSEMKRIWQ